jgi:chaperonin GroES
LEVLTGATIEKIDVTPEVSILRTIYPQQSTSTNRRIGDMKIRPLYDRIVVRRKEEETKTAGGIVLPGSAKEKPNQGEVVAIGQGKLLDSGEVRPLSVKVGDQVVFGQYSGNTIKVDGDELIILSETEIFGVLEK